LAGIFCWRRRAAVTIRLAAVDTERRIRDNVSTIPEELNYATT
jgi:hypothetical protein